LSLCTNQEVASEAYTGALKSTPSLGILRISVVNIQNFREAEQLIHQGQIVIKRDGKEQLRRFNAIRAHRVLVQSIRRVTDKYKHRIPDLGE